MSSTNKELKKQIPRNAVYSVLNFTVYALSAFWLTPYLYRHLGPAAYGLVPIAALFTQYVSIITSEISAAISRFLTIEIQKPDGNPSVVFNSAFALYLILALTQLPLFAVGLYFADRLFTIPAELKTDALLLLGCSGAGFLLMLVGSVFSVPQFSKNRLDIGYVLNVISLVVRLALILLLFAVFGPRLRYIGFVDLFLELVFFGVGLKIWRLIAPELKLDWRLVDWKMLRPVFRMSFWTLFNRMGVLLYHRTDIWIINRFISPAAAGQYAAILVLANFIRQLGNHFSGQLAPSIMAYWAKQDLTSLKRLLRFTMKVQTFALAIPVALICAYGDELLGWWLGADAARFSLLLLVLCIHLPVNLAALPLLTLNTASNSVKIPAVVTLVLGVMNVAASYYAGVVLGMGALGVAMATAVFLTLKDALFMPVYGSGIMGMPRWSWLGYAWGGALVTGAFYLLSRIPLADWIGLEGPGIVRLVIQGVFVTLVALVPGWLVILKKDEKRVLLEMVSAVLHPTAKMSI